GDEPLDAVRQFPSHVVPCTPFAAEPRSPALECFAPRIGVTEQPPPWAFLRTALALLGADACHRRFFLPRRWRNGTEPGRIEARTGTCCRFSISGIASMRQFQPALLLPQIDCCPMMLARNGFRPRQFIRSH